ncbi:hypothetical protein MalM25_15320 [Planctomycetes bacterium MalM25]|nr:hypothetical protein MalM25_15320 [Planctomycetes bacterium MalM25]
MAQDPSRSRGRPEALDAAAREVLVALLTVGVSRAAAARYVEVSPQTLANTADRDPAFAKRLELAEASHLFEHARVVEMASQKNWRASAWALGRLAPDRFGDPNRRSLRRSRTSRQRRWLKQAPDLIGRILEEELPAKASAAAKRRVRDRLVRLCERLLNPDRSAGS